MVSSAGTTKERGVLFLFGCLMVINTLASVPLGHSFRNKVEGNMWSGLENYGKEGHGGISHTWDLVQRDLHCCGVTNYMDWSGVSNFSEGQTPDSCCKVSTPEFHHIWTFKHLLFTFRKPLKSWAAVSALTPLQRTKEDVWRHSSSSTT